MTPSDHIDPFGLTEADICREFVTPAIQVVVHFQHLPDGQKGTQGRYGIKQFF